MSRIIKHIKMIQTYQNNTNISRWYKYIRNDTSDEAVRIEAKVRGWGMQWPEDLLHLMKELELDK